jgi:hypothetical protein
MKRKKPKSIPWTMNCEPMIELKPVPLTGSLEPTPELKFLPPVTLSYESTLGLKPIPVTLSSEDAGKAGKGAVKRMTKAVRTVRPKKAVASAKVRSLGAKKARVKRKGA